MICSLWLFCGAWVCLAGAQLYTKAGFHQYQAHRQVNKRPKALQYLPSFVICLLGSITESLGVYELLEEESQ